MLKVASETKVQIAECFLSLQGEGPSVGFPAHFVRLQGCSVGCRWCDTKYSWAADAGEGLALRDLGDRLLALGASDLLVITGGEPLESDAFLPLVEWASSRWDRVEVETSGYRPPPQVPSNVHWNWSPKLPSATQKADATWQHAAGFLRSGRFVCKVVVDSQGDWGELCRRVVECGIPRELVVVMPQGMQAGALAERSRWLAPLVIERGFRLTPRFHVDIWGARRGV